MSRRIFNRLSGGWRVVPVRDQPFVFGVVGWKDSGKTTLVTALVVELTARGFAVSTVKHAHHSFDVDQPGRDSHKHRLAGAQEVALVSAHRVAIMQELHNTPEPALTDILARLNPSDIVIFEGFKRADFPKIEVFADSVQDKEPLYPNDKYVIAVAGRPPNMSESPPIFSRDAISDLTDFILKHGCFRGEEDMT